MTFYEWVDRLDARRVGTDHFRAGCPGPLHRRRDRDPSLDIGVGRDGRVLLCCRVGCSTADIVAALGLSMRDLFAVPLTPAQAREAERKRKIAEAAAAAERRERGKVADTYRKLNETQDAIAAQLVDMVFRQPTFDENEADALAVVLHATIDKVRKVDAIYERQEVEAFHDRLVRYCAKWHIDRQRLLAPHLDDEVAA